LIRFKDNLKEMSNAQDSKPVIKATDMEQEEQQKVV
jgi:hypothetical protein